MNGLKYLPIILLLSSCFFNKSKKGDLNTSYKNQVDSTLVNTSEPDENSSKLITTVPTIYTDILHIDLNLSFDFPKEIVEGEIILNCKPFANPVDTLILDASRFIIKTIEISKESSSFEKANFIYKDSEQLYIYLPEKYRNDIYKVHIIYQANPKELVDQRGLAISSDKGLYFINSQNKYIDRPQQIWTQGETEHNHNWFPFIDHPNEKFTQKITITVDSNLTTLSNGLLTSSKINQGLRTDVWEQKLPHSGYLVMLAIGNFKKTTDYWTNSNGKTIEVSYYTEPDFAPYARLFFGKTPEMLSCFSNVLGIPYPWDKYNQVVVREYVSGAMENTSATLHGEFMNKTPRQYYENSHEDVVAHELFHQWFGDLVTCKSWHHISLNESFATFGEILWHEYKYGKDNAQLKFQSYKDAALNIDKIKNIPLIRKSYEIPEEVFDQISYPKGGAIIQMLRNELGDYIFFKGLKIYLTRYAYSNAEAHQLRLAFEEASGRDLNWFFNQWYFAPGHPQFSIDQQFENNKKNLNLIINQNGFNNTEWFPYKLKIEVGLVSNKKLIVQEFSIEQLITEIKLNSQFPIDAVILDPNQKLIAEFDIKYSPKEIIKMMEVASTFAQRSYILDLIQEISWELYKDDEKQIAFQILNKWAADTTFLGSHRAIAVLNNVENQIDRESLLVNICHLAANDSRKNVRSNALSFISECNNSELIIPVLDVLIYDSSYAIQESAFRTYLKLDSNAAYLKAIQIIQNSNDGQENYNILNSLSNYSFQETGNWLLKKLNLKNYKQMNLWVNASVNYLYNCNKPETSKSILLKLEEIHQLKVKDLDINIEYALEGLKSDITQKGFQPNSTEESIINQIKLLLNKWGNN